MKNVPMLVTGLLVVLLFFSCTPREEIEPEVEIYLTTHDIEITLIEKQWKIRPFQVSRGDTVVWRAPEDSDVYIQFMDDRLVGSYTEIIEKGQVLSKIIGQGAMQGPNPYAVFIYEEKAYAQGQSPPRLIVRAM